MPAERAGVPDLDRGGVADLALDAQIEVVDHLLVPGARQRIHAPGGREETCRGGCGDVREGSVELRRSVERRRPEQVHDGIALDAIVVRAAAPAERSAAGAERIPREA